MKTTSFPLEKIFGSRTRVKIMTLFTVGVKRPHFVREIARSINERLNAVRRELIILEKIGMLSTYEEKHRKYYTLNPDFPLVDELTSIMQKSGPGIEDDLFGNLSDIGDIDYMCLSGYFTGAAESPTDMLIIGATNEQALDDFVKHVEKSLGRDITYTPMSLNEFKYRSNFNDMFLRSIFRAPHKEMVNKLEADLDPSRTSNKKKITV